QPDIAVSAVSLLKWLRRKPEVDPRDLQRLSAVPAPLVPGEQLLAEQRFVVVDLEATGLHTGRDKILSIGAVAVEGSAIHMGLQFLDFVGDSPLVAFHADFDQRLLQRELRDFFGYSFKHPFFDLAELAPLLNPDHCMRQPRMDDWIEYFGLTVMQRHNACADAL